MASSIGWKPLLANFSNIFCDNDSHLRLCFPSRMKCWACLNEKFMPTADALFSRLRATKSYVSPRAIGQSGWLAFLMLSGDINAPPLRRDGRVSLSELLPPFEQLRRSNRPVRCPVCVGRDHCEPLDLQSHALRQCSKGIFLKFQSINGVSVRRCKSSPRVTFSTILIPFLVLLHTSRNEGIYLDLYFRSCHRGYVVACDVSALLD